MAEQDQRRIDELSAEECWALVATQVVGRLGVVIDGYPVIVPVNFAMDDEIVVLRMGAGTVSSAADRANVTFQVDSIDRDRRTGWSVLVRGLVEEVGADHGAALASTTSGSAAQPWAPGERAHLKRLIPHGVSGRQLLPGGLPDVWEADWYR